MIDNVQVFVLIKKKLIILTNIRKSINMNTYRRDDEEVMVKVLSSELGIVET